MQRKWISDFGSFNGTLLHRVSREWKGWVKEGEQHRELTHTLFTGGRFSIVDQHSEDFLRAYALDVQNGVPHFVNELRTPVFNLFIDVDFVGARELTDEECVALTAIAQSTIAEFYPDAAAPPFAVICRAAAKAHEKGAKSGVHVHFPNLKVDRVMAMTMRGMLLVRLAEQSTLTPLNPGGWGDVIDEQVYIHSGLRLLGSLKLVGCPHCAKAKCDVCITGMLVEKRPYAVTAAVGGDGRVDEDVTALLKSDIAKAVFYCSIRSLGSVTPGWRRMPGCPSFYDVQESNHRRADRKEFQPGVAHKLDVDGSTAWKRSTSVVDDKEKIAIVEFLIQKRMRVDKYRALTVQALHFYGKGKEPCYWAKVRPGFGSSYCLNKMADHSRNSIYFEVTMEGICQRCFCGKDTVADRVNGVCKKWRSSRRGLSSEHQRVLFGPQVAMKKRALALEMERAMSKGRPQEKHAQQDKQKA